MKPEQITAWALDEASAEERLQLEAELRGNPTAQKGADETKAFCAFLLAELRDESLALTDEQRERLQTAPVAAPNGARPSGEDVRKAVRQQPRWRTGTVVRTAVAACLAMGSFWVWQEYGKRTHGAEAQVAEVPETRYKVHSPQDALTRDQAPSPIRAATDKGKKGPAVTGAFVPRPMEPLPAAKPSSNVVVVQNSQLGTITGLTGQDVTRLKALEDQQAYGLGYDAASLVAAASGDGALSVGSSSRSAMEVRREFNYSALNAPQLPLSTPGPTSSVMNAGAGTLVFSGATTYTGGAVMSHSTSLAGVGLGNPTAGGMSISSGTLVPEAPPRMQGSFADAAMAVGAKDVPVSVNSLFLTRGDLAAAKTLADPAARGLILDGSSGAVGATTFTGSASSAQAPSPTLSNPIAPPAPLLIQAAGARPSAPPGGLVLTSGGTVTTAGTHAGEGRAQRLEINGAVSSLPGVLNSSSATTSAVIQGTGAVLADSYVTVPGNPTPLVADPMPDAHYFGMGEATGRERAPTPEKKMPQPRLRESSSESYQRIVENELKDVVREPLSTFSIDVDTAAYANVRRFLNQNMIPPADAVRIEELVNYFPAAEEGPAPAAKEPFAVRVEMAPCPWQPVHRLARIAIKGRELGNERKASNLVFLVDVSGSMDDPSKLPLVQQSLRMLAEQLGDGDRVTMVVYAGSSGLVLPPTSGDKKTEILAAIDKLKAGGSTHGSAGIQLAYEQAVANFIKGGVNRVILCTDGDFNVGVSSPEELEKLITKKAKSGVFLSVLGFGTGNLKDHTMETLADKGNGNYAYIDSLGEARKVLVEQMSGTLVTIAKDVKIQVEFNPAAVRSYRLVGYENRLLKKEDFNDDTKDAGEIGAGHSVVALYEVVPANLPPGAEPRPAVDTLRYQQVPAAPAPTHLAEAAKNGEVMTVKLRYKEPDSSLSKLIEVPTKDEGKTLTASSAEFKFSAAVAGFGLLLRDSAYKGTLGWETVRKLALDGKGADKMGYRGEFLQLIDKARGLKETRP